MSGINDYIRIRGDNTDSAPFQGIGGSGSGGTSDFSALIEPLNAIADALKPAGIESIPGADISPLFSNQTKNIQEQTEYLQILATRFEDDAAGNTGITGILKNFALWLAEQSVKQVLAEFIEKRLIVLDALGEIGDDIADMLADAIIDGAMWLIDFFEKKASPAGKRCHAMIRDNNGMIDLTMSWDNYNLRKDVLAAHQEEINHLESQLVEANTRMMAFVAFIVDVIKAFMGSGASEEEEEGWDTVIESLGDSADGVRDWLNAVEEADKEDLPIPSLPTLPSPPGDAKKAVTRKVIYMLAKYGFQLATEIMRKQRETDTHLTDLVQAVDELKFNGVRFHASSGDIVELTGIGTVAESYQS